MKLNIFVTNTIKSFINNIIYFYKKDNNTNLINNESSTKEEEILFNTQLGIIPLTNAEYFENLTETDNFFLMSLTQSLSDSQDVLNAGYNPSLKVKKIINNLLLVDFAHNILKIPKEFVNTLNTNELADTLFSDNHHINKSIKLINFLGDNKLLLPNLLFRMENKYSVLNIFQEINFLSKNKSNHLSNDPYKKFRDKYLHTNFSSIFLSISDFFPNNKQHKESESFELSANSQVLINNNIIKEQDKLKDNSYFNETSKTYKTYHKEKKQVFEDDESLEDSQIRKIQKDKIIKNYKLALLEEELILHKEINSILSALISNNSLSDNLKDDKSNYIFKEHTNNSLFVNTIIDKIIESNIMTPKDIFVQMTSHNNELAVYLLLKYKEDVIPFLTIDKITYMIKYFEKSLKKEDNTEFFDFLLSIQKELKSNLKDTIIQKLNSKNYTKAIEDFNFIKIGDILNLPSNLKLNLSNIQNKVNELENITLNIEQNRFLDSLKKEIISNINHYTSIKEIDPNIDINSTIKSISDLEISITTFQKTIIDEQLKALQNNNNTLKVRFK